MNPPNLFRRIRIPLVAAAMVLIATPLFAGWLGIGVGDVTSDKLAALKLKEERGVEIVAVSPNSPAAQAGLREHDVVLEYNGQRVESVEQFQRLVRETPAGRSAKVLISRDGATQTLTAKLGNAPLSRRRRAFGPSGEYGMVMPPMPPMPPGSAAPHVAPMPPDFPFEMPDIEVPEVTIFTRSSRLGIDGESLPHQLGEYFGAPNGEGVLVRSVEDNSAADKAGLKAGDVIVKVDSEKVTTIRDLRSALRQRSGKTDYALTVVRNRKEVTVTVKIERPEHSRDWWDGGAVFAPQGKV